MAIGPLIAVIAAGIAAGTAKGALTRQRREEDLSREIMKKSAFERASKGDVGFADNPEMVKALGKPGVQALLNYAQSIAQQTAETERGEAQARAGGFFPGGDPLAGMTVGKKGGTIAGAPGAPGTPTGPLARTQIPAFNQEPGAPTPEIPAAMAPQAALAQSVTGPAAGPADEETGVSVPPQGAPQRPVSGMERLQQNLPPGQTVSGKVGGLNFSVRGLEAGEKADAVGRRIIADGIAQKMRPDEIITNVFAVGGKLPENFKAYSDSWFVKAFRQNLKEAGVDTKSATTIQKIAATRAALESGGSVPDAFKSMVGFTREDEHAMAGEVVTRALGEGVPFAQARAYAESRGLRLSKEDEVALGQRTYGELKSELAKLLPDLSPEQLAGLAAMGVKNDPRFVPPDERQAIREAAPMAPETRAKVFEETGKVPRLSDVAGAPGIAGARKRAEGEATDVAATRAGAVKGAQEDVPERMPQGVQETIKALDNSIAGGQRIHNGYKPEYVGPAKARIDNLKEKFIDKSLPAAESKFRSDLQEFLNEAIFQLTGKQVGSIVEAERILGPLPNINLPPSAFEARLSALRERLSAKRKTEADMAQSQRYRPAPPPPKTTEDRPTPPAGTSEISPEERRLRKRLGIK